MTLDLTDTYDLRVPRYTSYPTAPHFHAGVNADTYLDWLGALDPGEPLSLYLHVPFCDQMCWFCGCYTKVVRRYEPIRAYLDTLEREIDHVAAALPGRFVARHVHWGGGSPSLLRPDDWRTMSRTLSRHFDLGEGAEVAVEVDPRDTTPEYVTALAEAGVNRVSIGVQDFDATVQRAINRLQPFEVVARVVGWLRACGIADINLDLMYGLPHQTVDGVVAMVDLCCDLEPSRMALFGYAHVPWMKAHQRLIDERALPDAPDRLRQFTAASHRLEERGFRPVGLDHFARNRDGLVTALDHGRLRRNFQGYTTDAAATLLGFGASAIGALPRGYVQNTAPLAQYREAVAAGRPPVARGIALSADDRLRRDVIERLMCDLRVDLAAVCGRHGEAPEHLAAEWARLQPLVEDGIVALDGWTVRVTEPGRPYLRIVAAIFDAYLDGGVVRHSRAV